MSKEISTRADRRLHLGAILSGVVTADTVANEIERRFRQGTSDGFNYRIGNPVDFALSTQPTHQDNSIILVEIIA
jgi:hypothetical protein